MTTDSSHEPAEQDAVEQLAALLVAEAQERSQKNAGCLRVANQSGGKYGCQDNAQ